jgi:hypothetical protein
MVFNVPGLRGLEMPDNFQLPYSSSRTLESSLDFAEYTRTTAGVEFIPGEGFGFRGSDMALRMTIGKREEVFREAFKQIQESILNLRVTDRFEEVQEEESKKLETASKLSEVQNHKPFSR